MVASVRVEKSWGYEEIIHNGDYCCKKLVYAKEIASSLHYHPIKHETFVVRSGRFSVELPDGKIFMNEGDFVVIPPNTTHRVRCLTNFGEIIESSTHDDPLDCVRLIPSET